MQKRLTFLALNALEFPYQKRGLFKVFHAFITQNLLTVSMLKFSRIRMSFGTHGKYMKDCVKPNNITFRYLDSKITHSPGFSYLSVVPFIIKYFFCNCNSSEGVLNQ
jgi:hypothetical protein